MASKTAGIAGLYDMEKTLGSGHFAVVKSARHAFTGLRVAIKVIDKLKLDEVSRTHLYQEVRCMKLVSHPSIIRLYEVIDTQTKLYLIQELGDGGDLYDFIMKHPNGVKEDVARQIFRQAVSAIRYCHKLHVVHRDLKPENLVICTGVDEAGNMTTTPRVKLTDFGLSRTFLPGELIESSCGSLEYSAPEILLGDSYDPPKIDVWSLGVILYMLITGHSPFAYGGAGEILARIMDSKYQCPPHVSELCRNLIAVMLLVDSHRRASLDQVAVHMWLKGEDEEEEQVPLPAISSVDEIPQEELEVILSRMNQGGYGSMEAILKLLGDKPYGSTAATFFLLAEAEYHRKHFRSHHTTQRKSSFSSTRGTPNGPHFHMSTPPHLRSLGSAESGVLRKYTSPLTTPSRHTSVDIQGNGEGQQQGSYSAPSRRTLNHAFTSPVPFRSPAGLHLPGNTTTPIVSPQYQPFTKTSVGVAGEERLLAPKSSFPLNVQQSEEEQQPALAPSPVHTNTVSSSSSVNMDNIDFNPHIFRGRALSVFEEESETECMVELSNQIRSRQHSSSPSHHSPLHSNSPHLGSPHARSRRISNARSSPNIFGSVSKSDASDDEEEEEDDDIVELMTTSGRFPSKASTFSRISPSSSPLLTSRYSPTHYLTGGSSDDESCSVFETARQIRSKRLPFRKRSIPKLVRVDSISSDDGKSSHDVKATPTRKGRLLRLRQYNSLPSAPADNSASESLTELLDTFRKTQTMAAATSCQTYNSLSDGGGGAGDKDVGELTSSMFSKFELSDEDGLQASMELDPHLTDLSTMNTTIVDGKGSSSASCSADVEAQRDMPALRAQQASTTLHSVMCSLL